MDRRLLLALIVVCVFVSVGVIVGVSVALLYSPETLRHYLIGKCNEYGDRFYPSLKSK